MSATISIIVLNKLSHCYSPTNATGTPIGEDIGISNVAIVLKYPDDTFSSILYTDIEGKAVFTNLTQSGLYTIYELGYTQGTLPDDYIVSTPLFFTQPHTFTTSTTQRFLEVLLPDDISTSTLKLPLSNESGNIYTEDDTNYYYYFGHVALTPLGTNYIAYQVSTPEDSTDTTFHTIHLVSGVEDDGITLNPSGVYNAIGYNVNDGYIYGFMQLLQQLVIISDNGMVTKISAVSNLPIDEDNTDTYASKYNVGDINLEGYLYIYSCYYREYFSADSYYVIDVNSNSINYLQLVDPNDDYNLQTETFGVPLTMEYYDPILKETIWHFIDDWAFNPNDDQLYSVLSQYPAASKVDTSIAVEQSPVICINPKVGGIPTQFTMHGTLPINNVYGALFADKMGSLYALSNSGIIYQAAKLNNEVYSQQFAISPNCYNSDGARSALAYVTGPLTIHKSSDKTSALPDRKSVV